jgi:hypothetical protein
MDMVFLLKCHLCVSLCFSCNIMFYLKKTIYIYIYIYFFFIFLYTRFPRRFHFLRACFVPSRFGNLETFPRFVQLRCTLEVQSIQVRSSPDELLKAVSCTEVCISFGSELQI